MSSRKNILITVLILLTIGLVNQALASDAEPAGVREIDPIGSETFNASLYNPASTYAEAGNISEINLDAIGRTRSWAGFFGEITGEIVLEDAAGHTLYNWSNAEPQGQIFASTSNTISWLDVGCLDAANAVTWRTTEDKYSIDEDDADSIIRTFVSDNHPTFWIGNNEITGCNTTWTFVNSEVQTDRFPMAILEDEVSGTDLYVTWIENRDKGNITDVVGFDGSTHDFQFMVPENGTNNNVITTQYYFWATIY